jgi:hypothetical protein
MLKASVILPQSGLNYHTHRKIPRTTGKTSRLRLKLRQGASPLHPYNFFIFTRRVKIKINRGSGGLVPRWVRAKPEVLNLWFQDENSYLTVTGKNAIFFSSSNFNVKVNYRENGMSVKGFGTLL